MTTPYLCILILDTFGTLPATGKILIDHTLPWNLQDTQRITSWYLFIMNQMYNSNVCSMHACVYLYTFWVCNLTTFRALHECLGGLGAFSIFLAPLFTYGTDSSQRQRRLEEASELEL